MTLLEGFLRDNLLVDFGSEVQYGSDQVFQDHPCRFATVGFELMATSGLEQIADRIRIADGYKPIHPMDGYTEGTCDGDGFYIFYVGINGYAQTHMDSCIEFLLVNSDSPDNEELNTIGLSLAEQEMVYASLDSQCREYLGKGCEELLLEASRRMEGDMD